MKRRSATCPSRKKAPPRFRRCTAWGHLVDANALQPRRLLTAHLAHSRVHRLPSPFRSHSRRSAGATGTRLRAPKQTLAVASRTAGLGGFRSFPNLPGV
jgi:hypothetical protein